MGFFKIDRKDIESNLIEDVGDIVNLENLNPAVFSFTIKLKSGEIINYLREYNKENESMIRLGLEKLQLKLINEIKKRKKMGERK